jgi:hypothetical protein
LFNKMGNEGDHSSQPTIYGNISSVRMVTLISRIWDNYLFSSSLMSLLASPTHILQQQNGSPKGRPPKQDQWTTKDLPDQRTHPAHQVVQF